MILPFFIGHLKAQERPNVIVIISDDQGWGDVGFNGGKDIPTTHLDFWHRRALVLVQGMQSILIAAKQGGIDDR